MNDFFSIKFAYGHHYSSFNEVKSNFAILLTKRFKQKSKYGGFAMAKLPKLPKKSRLTFYWVDKEWNGMITTRVDVSKTESVKYIYIYLAGTRRTYTLQPNTNHFFPTKRNEINRKPCILIHNIANLYISYRNEQILGLLDARGETYAQSNSFIVCIQIHIDVLYIFRSNGTE